MASKKNEISIRSATYDKLRAYCRKHTVQMRSVVYELVTAAIDEAERKAAEANKPSTWCWDHD